MNRSVSTFYENRSHSKSRSKSHSKSPSRSIMGIRLYNFSKIESYGQIRGPVFTQLKRQNIKSKLDLEKISEIRYKERIQHGQLFLDYENNPFLVNKKHAMSQMNISSDNMVDQNARRSSRNLVEECNKLKQKGGQINRRKESKLLANNQKQAVELSKAIQERAARVATPRKVQVLPQHRSAVTLKTEDREDLIFRSTMDFKDIVSIPEASYFRKTRDENFNIFKILFQKEQTNILDQYYFYFGSFITTKSKIHVENDLSREARACIRKIVQLSPNQIVEFDTHRLNFADLISVAAGKLTPTAVYQNIYKAKVRGRDIDSSSIEDESGIIYADTAANKLINVKNDLQSINQIKEYWGDQLEPKDQKYDKQIILRQKQISDQSNLEIGLLQRSIYDQTEHEQIKARVEEQLNNFIDLGYKELRTVQERNRLVRMRKQSRTKKEIIKLTRLLQSVQARQKQKREIKQIVEKRF